MSENHHDGYLEDLRQKSVDRLYTADILDVQAFEDLKAHLWRKASGLKDEFTLSKQILRVLRDAAKAIRSRAAYLPAVKAHVAMADDFDALLDRLILSETEDQRTPGVPRII